MKLVKSNKVYGGRIIDVYNDQVLLENDIQTEREVVRHRQAVAILALDEKDNIILVEQYRHPFSKKIVELPAGLIDEGESPLDAAKRELMEETGYSSDHWKKLVETYTSPGCHDEIIHIYVASKIKKTGEQSLDGDEILSFFETPVRKAMIDIQNGNITDSKTIIGILLWSTQNLLK